MTSVVFSEKVLVVDLKYDLCHNSHGNISNHAKFGRKECHKAMTLEFSCIYYQKLPRYRHQETCSHRTVIN